MTTETILPPESTPAEPTAPEQASPAMPNIPKILLSAKKPVVAIVGRPNVGKSTFINRIIGERRAIVDDKPGVTRDRALYEADWCGTDFYLMDTGGLVPDSDATFDKHIRQQVMVAMAEADVILFLVDGRDGVMPADSTIANLLRRQNHPVILGVNKIDTIELVTNIYEFAELGLGEPMSVSSVHGFGGVGNLLDAIVEACPAPPEQSADDADHDPDAIEMDDEAMDALWSDDDDSATGDVEPVNEDEVLVPRVALVGRPNVGKSSLVNAMLGERVIVTDIPGTTRDAIHTVMTQTQKDGTEQTMVLIDTAGVRKKSKVEFGVELFSVDRTIRAMDDADVVLMVVDATEGIAQQEKRLIEMSNEKGCGLIIVVNKWDLIEDKGPNSAKEMEATMRASIPHASFAKFIFVSAVKGQRMKSVIPAVQEVMTNARRRVSTSVVNQVMREALSLNPPPPVKNKILNILYATQARVAPPTFVLFVNDPKCVRPEYERYLERKLRDNIEFSGTPIRLRFRARSPR